MIHDNINSPVHYNKDGRKECIVEMRERFGALVVLFFCLMNLFKYDYRKGNKNDGSTNEKQDEQKGKWYLEYAYHIIVAYWWAKVVLYVFFNPCYKYVMENNKINQKQITL